MLKPLIKKFFLYGGPLWLLRQIQQRQQGYHVTVLFGHRVVDDMRLANEDDPNRVSGQTSVKEVAALIKLARKHFDILPLNQALSRLKSGTLKRNALVLTFDDGFRDNFTHLYPLLKDTQTPATLYINTSVVDSDNNLWFQSIINYFFNLKGIEVYNHIADKNYSLKDSHSRFKSAFHFMRHLQAYYKPEQFMDIIEKLAQGKHKPKTEDIHVTWEDLRAMSKDPLITLGAHTHRHYPLTQCDPELAEEEIKLSKTLLEDHLQCDIEHFCYPRGQAVDFNELHQQTIRSLGMKTATTTIPGINFADSLKPYQVKRLGLPQYVEGKEDEALWYLMAIPQTITALKSSLLFPNPKRLLQFILNRS